MIILDYLEHLFYKIRGKRKGLTEGIEMNDDFFGYDVSDDVVLHVEDFPWRLRAKRKQMFRYYPIIRDKKGNRYFLIKNDERYSLMYEIMHSKWMEDEEGNKYIRGIFHRKSFLHPIDHTK